MENLRWLRTVASFWNADNITEYYKLRIGNNPMVGCTVAVAVDVATALSK